VVKARWGIDLGLYKKWNYMWNKFVLVDLLQIKYQCRLDQN